MLFRSPVIPCSTKLEALFSEFTPSLTLTAKGFYGPQFRNAQLKPKYSLKQICELKYKGEALGNIEMETAGIYGLSALLGFEAISINAILANRDRKSTRMNSSHSQQSRMPSSA